MRWAAAAAARQGRTLQVVSVVELPSAPHFGEAVNTAQAYADAAREFAETALDIAVSVVREQTPDVTVDSVVLDGHPASALVELSQHAHTLVVGRRGQGKVQALLLGSVSSHVAAHAHCPVVVVAENPPTSGPVVVGIDGSPVSAAVTTAAFQLADELNAKLIAVHTYGDGVIAEGLYEQDKRPIARAAQKFLDAELAEGAAAHPSVEIEKVISEVGSAEEILDAAQGGQLVVVGTRGHDGFAGLLLGSTSQAILQLSPCPVMVHHP
ncbi:universal stress protein [Gordonia defluvii]|uniref:Universal stress protein n=1 Tax=Gordonia defluvii TaxID=283718 RepID=A0ABP6LFS0_9ACTN